jgi:hypothetical protein
MQVAGNKNTTQNSEGVSVYRNMAAHHDSHFTVYRKTYGALLLMITLFRASVTSLHYAAYEFCILVCYALLGKHRILAFQEKIRYFIRVP